MSRETVISALNRIDPQELESVPPRPLSLRELEATADELVRRYRVKGCRTFDLSGLQHELLEVLLSGRLSPSSAALVLARALGPVPIAQRASLALFLMNAIREGRIATLAHGALLALRRAASFSEPDVAAPVLRRIDAELSRRPAAFSRRGEVLLAADRLPFARLEVLLERVPPREEAPLQKVVLVVPDRERGVSEEVVLAHLLLQARLSEQLAAEVESLAAAGAVVLVDAVTLTPRSRPPALVVVRRALQRASRALVAALEPFAPVELVARGG